MTSNYQALLFHLRSKRKIKNGCNHKGPDHRELVVLCKRIALTDIMLKTTLMIIIIMIIKLLFLFFALGSKDSEG